MAFSEGVLAALRSKRREPGIGDGDPGGTLASLTDADLAREAATGDGDAFEELYRRHVESVWRVAQAVTNDEHDAADATSEAFVRVLRALQAGRMAPVDHFRAYLIAAARNSAIDIIRRRRKRLKEASTYAGTAAGPPEHVDRDEEAALIAKAFRSLPERWRATLWLTEVEGLSPSEAAPLLGVSGVGARQLAMRARAGLRHRYLQAHVDRQVAPECRFAVDHLVTYAGGNLAPRDVAKVDRHLTDCSACRERLHDLDSVGRRLRGLAIPIPLGLGALVLGHWSKAFAAEAARHAGAVGAAGHVRASAPRRVSGPARVLAPHAAKVVGVAAGALLAVGLAGSILVQPVPRTALGSGTVRRAALSPATFPRPVPPAVPGAAPLGQDSGQPGPSLGPGSGTVAPASPHPAAQTGPQSRPSAPGPPPTTPSAPSPPAPPSPRPLAEVGITIAPAALVNASAATGAGPGSCSGIWIRQAPTGCSGPPAANGAVAVSVQSTLLP